MDTSPYSIRLRKPPKGARPRIAALKRKFPRIAPFPPSLKIPTASWPYPLYPRSGGPAPDPYNPNGYPEPYQTLDTRVNIRLTTLLDVLIGQWPERFQLGHLRTLQRRVRDWRALHGPAKEVFFGVLAARF